MTALRNLRVGSLIREELAILLVRDVEFPKGVLVTITEVEVDKKLDRANVGISVYPSQKEREAVEILKPAMRELAHKLLKKINIKPMPRIHFFIDHGTENAAMVEKKLLEG